MPKNDSVERHVGKFLCILLKCLGLDEEHRGGKCDRKMDEKLDYKGKGLKQYQFQYEAGGMVSVLKLYC